MAFVIRTVLRSGTLTRSASTHEKLEDAIREAGAQLKKGFAVDAWIEDENGRDVDEKALKIGKAELAKPPFTKGGKAPLILWRPQ